MRLRFAPSPTGFLHIGNARTAIINNLIAKKNNATLVLRVEDTDQERSTRESEVSIIEDLSWLGIQFHEGPDVSGEKGPYRQSERFEIYKKYTDDLLENTSAFKCFCDNETVEAAKKEAESKKISYKDVCRNLTEDDIKNNEARNMPFVIRFKVPENKEIVVHDLVKGDVIFNSDHIGGDFVLVRTDGSPVYNYIVSIDDALMEITHVVRGEDHLSNTPKQLLIAQALGLPVPQYAHLALVLGPDRSKLSKRHGMTSVVQYRNEGYLPEALVNYITMLGWATESGDEILTMEELINSMDIQKLAKSAAIFDFQKLKWVNSQYINSYDLSKLTDLLSPYIAELGYSIGTLDKPYVEEIISLVRGSCELLPDIKNYVGIFLEDVNTPDDETSALLREQDSQELIKKSHSLFSSYFTEGNFIEELINKIKEETGFKGKKLFKPIRAMLTGRLSGPDLMQALPLIGFEHCKSRVDYCLKTYCK